MQVILGLFFLLFALGLGMMVLGMSMNRNVETPEAGKSQD